MAKKIKDKFLKIHLVDRCLIIFMTVLLLQTTYSMFASINGDEKSNGIDIVIRTSTAAIFGYFLSGNFVKQESRAEKKLPTETPTAPINQVGIYSAENLGVSAFSQISENPTAAINKGEIYLSENVGVSAFSPISENPIEKKEPIKEYHIQESNDLQIIAAAAIGLYCIVILLIARNISMLIPNYQYSQDALATVSQFRDFISGCVGFLIGTPTTKS